MRGWTGFVPLLCLLACGGCGKQKSTDQLLADLKSPQERDRLIAVRLLQQRKGDAAQVVPALNETGLLPGRLRRWAGDGLHDDVMMYRPAYFRDDELQGVTLRYGMLQGRGYLPRYVAILLAGRVEG